jgi:hypothetical protein
VMEVELVLMGRRVGAVVETEFAVVALVDDAMMIGGRQLRHVAFVPVDAVQQGVERGTEVETAAAPVADLVDPERFLVQSTGIERGEKAEGFHGNERAQPSLQQTAVSLQLSGNELPG